MEKALILSILAPLSFALLALFVPRRAGLAVRTLLFAGALVNLAGAIFLFNKQLVLSLPWAGYGLDFALKNYSFSSLIILAAASLSFLIALYCGAFLKGKEYLKSFTVYFLVSLAFVNGAVLADNLLLLLFFWEGLLATIFGMIAIGGKDAFKTATKAFIIVGITDLCMMLGIALTAHLCGTLVISNIKIPQGALGSVAFILLMIGAISKAGSMPFHTWIPDAAKDAPLPFMAFFPGALEKLLGIYFLARISLDMYALAPGSWLSILLMIIGGLTIILAVLMALIQKDYKRLLSYHAISQVGYMVLGIGTALPAGIIGGIFHMLNNAMYKCCLFLTGGAVERQAGTTDLEKLGGIGLKMPVTFGAFLIAALSISGVPPFNGFFSKELVYDAALQRGGIFYFAAVLGSFFTAASFLKLGHAAYLGKSSPQQDKLKEAPWQMLLPMAAIAAACVLFGVFHRFPVEHLIQPGLGMKALGHEFSGMPDPKLTVITVVVLILALLNHLYGVRMNGGALKAADHIHYAPALSRFFDLAEKKAFDPYEIGLKFTGLISRACVFIDGKIDWLYNNLSVNSAYAASAEIKRLHTGNYAVYFVYSLLGVLFVLWMFFVY